MKTCLTVNFNDIVSDWGKYGWTLFAKDGSVMRSGIMDRPRCTGPHHIDITPPLTPEETKAVSHIVFGGAVVPLIETGEIAGMINTRDLYRLAKLNQAVADANAGDIPEDSESLNEEMWNLHDAIAAGQSLDDLGSEELNQKAMDDTAMLLKRFEEVKAKLKNVSPVSGREEK